MHMRETKKNNNKKIKQNNSTPIVLPPLASGNEQQNFDPWRFLPQKLQFWITLIMHIAEAKNLIEKKVRTNVHLLSTYRVKVKPSCSQDEFMHIKQDQEL